MRDNGKQRIGIIGGGQLAAMTAIAAPTVGVEVVVLTPRPSDPAAPVASEAILGDLDDVDAIARLAERCDVVSFENEFVDLEQLQRLADRGVCFRPSLGSLAPLLDKYHQRRYLQALSLPVPRFIAVEPGSAIASPWGFPVVLKARRQGYDGRGTFILPDERSLQSQWEKLERPGMLLEEFIPFDRELAVMAARGVTGEIAVYPAVETQQENQVCRRVLAPATLSEATQTQIETVARSLLEGLHVTGMLGIELFLAPDEKILVNEIAPRAHNSGHYTLDACETSQFAMHLQAIAGKPLGNPQMQVPSAVMVNLLGFERAQSNYPCQRDRLAEIDGARVFWYGKTESHPGRKLGHVTVLLDTDNRERALAIARQVESIWYDKQTRSLQFAG